ncbi:hypothetical protein LCGC14_0561030 [marine sediment metagenome]|uniref:Uncharacterized protein n=1 Tax=marine sediment metagenome TaxID=412755 RepID=A0A0F9S5N7_9ZZZZ
MKARTLIDKNWNLFTAMTQEDGRDIVFRLLGYLEVAKDWQMTKPKLVEFIAKQASELQASRS